MVLGGNEIERYLSDMYLRDMLARDSAGKVVRASASESMSSLHNLSTQKEHGWHIAANQPTASCRCRNRYSCEISSILLDTFVMSATADPHHYILFFISSAASASFQGLLFFTMLVAYKIHYSPLATRYSA